MSAAEPPAAAEWTPPSWEEIVRQHSPRVFRLAYRLTGNAHDAEDLTQDVFVRVFRSLHRFQPGTFEGWLHRITTNLFLDGARRRQKIRFDGLAEGGRSGGDAEDGADEQTIAGGDGIGRGQGDGVAGLDEVFHGRDSRGKTKGGPSGPPVCQGSGWVRYAPGFL